MRVHLVVKEPEKRRWILRPWAEALAQALPDAVIGLNPDPNAVANLFINYAGYSPVPTLTMGMFTHRNPDRRGEIFDRVAHEVDWCFAQSKLTASLLPPEKTSVLPTGPSNAFFRRPLVLGVVGKEKKSGRKRMHWIEDLRTVKGVEVRRAAGSIPDVDMPSFYDSIDYLVVLGSNEGGPQPVLEALARCKPVIAPNVGYCWEYPVLRYSTKEELLNIIRGLVTPQDVWKRAARIIHEVIGRLKG